MSLLDVRELTCRFGGLTAVDAVSFAVSEGEIVGVIGPNGAGKTTLFSAIAGFVRPAGGRVVFRGNDVTGWRPHEATAAGLARTFQLMRVFGSMTVAENIMVGAYLRHRSRSAARAAADWVLDLTELAELRNVPAHGLTAASKKRLEIARALATEPRLLLLDEVLSGLTPTERIAAVELVRDFRDTGIAVLMVEHVMEVIMPLCDRVVVLHHGQKIGEGSPAQVANDPAVLDAYLGA